MCRVPVPSVTLIRGVVEGTAKAPKRKDSVNPAVSNLRKLGSVVAGDSWGETFNPRMTIQRMQRTLSRCVIHDGFGASLARGSHSAPSGTTERHTL